MTYLITTNIEINAPLEIVWDILINCDDYRLWNPFVVEAQGRVAPHAQLVLSPKLTPTRQTTFQAVVTSYKEHVEFTWTGAIGHRWFAMGDHTFRLQRTTKNTALLDHDELFYGIGGRLLGFIAGNLTRRNFVAMNEAVKNRAENFARQVPTATQLGSREAAIP